MNNSTILENNSLNINDTNSDPSTTNVTDNSWGKSDIMALAFGLFSVVFTILAIYFAWKTYYKDRRKELKEKKAKRWREDRERETEVDKRANTDENSVESDKASKEEESDKNSVDSLAIKDVTEVRRRKSNQDEIELIV